MLPFLRYAAIGATGVTLDLVVFALLFNVGGVHEQVANALSTTLGIVCAFLLNSRFTFGKRDRMLSRFARFYGVGVFGIGVTTVALHVFATGLGVDPNLVKSATIPCVAVLQYWLNKKWSFA
ncbi:GtrA family protein [Nonomuraea sp. NBC_01738]|uniref:GtrA family protein n=1 Tax=Nonomuraea sp. NBC_01738 TaxID=2976003 RepID=UPI002E15FF8E|nr:GtrA family protein [Nonomuraea sp. NBC_01738]